MGKPTWLDILANGSDPYVGQTQQNAINMTYGAGSSIAKNYADELKKRQKESSSNSSLYGGMGRGSGITSALRAGVNGIVNGSNNSTGRNPWYSGGGGGWYSGGGGGGGSVDPTPTDQQKDAFNNLMNGIVPWNYEALTSKLENTNKLYDTADDQIKALQKIQEANAYAAANGDWYRQQQKEQSTTSQLINRAGNMMNGAMANNIYEAVARVDDQNDDDTLQSLRDNIINATMAAAEALQANVNARNKNAVDTETSIRELFGDAAAQISSMNTMLANGKWQEGYTSLDPDAKKGDKPKDADKYPAIIDTENKTLNIPDGYEVKDFAKNHWTNAYVPFVNYWFREADSATKASDTGNREQRYGSSSSANDYSWLRSYPQSRRTQ